MTTKNPQVRYTIVVGVDYSTNSNLVLQRAFEIANRVPAAEPHVVHATTFQEPLLGRQEVLESKIDEASDKLRHYVQGRLADFKLHNQTAFERVVAHVRVGAPAHEIAQLAADLDADMVVVGTHGRRGVRRLLLGSVAEGAMRLSHCPVLAVQPKDHSGEMQNVPEIEPPCPVCVEVRRRTGGRELWCPRHAEKHGRRHTYHYVDRNASAHENLPLAEREDPVQD